MKTVIIDEREEMAACNGGVPQNDIGISSDVITGYSKGAAVMIALRSMSPQKIVLDEIGNEDEAVAIEAGLNSGVDFFLSVHASSETELLKRKQIVRLLKSGAFSKIIFLKGKDNPSKIEKCVSVGDLYDKYSWLGNTCTLDNSDWFLCSSRGEQTS